MTFQICLNFVTLDCTFTGSNVAMFSLKGFISYYVDESINSVFIPLLCSKQTNKHIILIK